MKLLYPFWGNQTWYKFVVSLSDFPEITMHCLVSVGNMMTPEVGWNNRINLFILAIYSSYNSCYNDRRGLPCTRFMWNSFSTIWPTKKSDGVIFVHFQVSVIKQSWSPSFTWQKLFTDWSSTKTCSPVIPLMVQKFQTTTWDCAKTISNPCKWWDKQDKLSTSTGERRISEPSTVWLRIV